MIRILDRIYYCNLEDKLGFCECSESLNSFRYTCQKAVDVFIDRLKKAFIEGIYNIYIII